MDCPIAQFEHSDGYELTVAVHNPSTNPLQEVRISVPKGFDRRWKASVWNHTA
jgi:hypothetical protein